MILVAEDNEVNQIVVEQILLEAGRDYKIVDNGQLAVDAYKEQRPQLILMDVSMPVMNGLEATEAIRALEEESGERTPIIGLTAHALKGDREVCMKAGMDDYMSKPISPDALIAKVAEWLDKSGDAVRAAV
jgi:CheY-like chemotaxis protein